MADLMYMQRLANELALKGAMTAPTRYRIVVAVVSPELDRIACASIARSPEEVERILQWGLDNLGTCSGWRMASARVNSASFNWPWRAR
jgi:hypothetical protein